MRLSQQTGRAESSLERNEILVKEIIKLRMENSKLKKINSSQQIKMLQLQISNLEKGLSIYRHQSTQTEKEEEEGENIILTPFNDSEHIESVEKINSVLKGPSLSSFSTSPSTIKNSGNTKLKPKHLLTFCRSLINGPTV